MFRDREDAARQLAARFQGRSLIDPVVLAIPRGGVVTGAVLAKEIGADLDVVLSRKLRAPSQPELAIGAICEDGHMYMSEYAREVAGVTPAYLDEERKRQMAETARRKSLIRAVRPRAKLEGRSVIVTDDGIATGSTMMAALQSISPQKPHELIVAVPVASPERLNEIRQWCDETICLLAPSNFWAIGQFYEDFSQVEDDIVVDLLREFAPAAKES